MPALAAKPALTRNATLDRVAHLAARRLNANAVAIFTGEPRAFTPRVATHPTPDLTPVAHAWSQAPGLAVILPNHIAGIAIANTDGAPLGLLLAALPAQNFFVERTQDTLKEMAFLVALELNQEVRRSLAPFPGPDRRKTQEQLLEKTLELAKFGEDLRQLHRLSTSAYDSQDDLFADYLATGRNIFGLTLGAVVKVRGRYAALAAVQDETLALRAGLTFSLSQVFCGVVGDTRATVASADLSQDPRLAGRSHFGALRQACYIGAPILIDGEIFGVLSFASPHPRRRGFSDHEIELVELMAKGIGRYLLETRMQAERERAELLEQDRSRVLELVAKDQPLEAVLAQIVRMVERQSPSIAAAILLVRDGAVFCGAAPSLPDHFRRKFHAAALLDADGCCLHAAFSRTTEVAYNAAATCAHEQCWQSCASTPILSGSGELLGVLAAYWRVAVQPRHVDAELLEMAGSLAAIAIEHRRLTERLAHQAHHDTLTGLPNRALLNGLLDAWIADAKRISKPLSVVFVDLDRFKQINDHLGHAAGDAVLSEIAQRLRRCLRGREIVARLGGDEFVLLLEADCQNAHLRSQEILEVLRRPISWEGHDLLVTASIGLAGYQPGTGAEELLSQADLAMYQVKNSGKDNVAAFTRDTNGNANQLEMEQALRRALERNELHLHLQPIWDLRHPAPILDGFEALLSWEHPTLGRISPAQFIPLAEECGLIAGLGAWVLREACQRGAALPASGHANLRIAVNVSPLQFQRPDFVAVVLEALAATGLDPQLLELELTESAIVENVPAAVAKLERLRSLGVRIALDDFGTGYSSLGYLRWIPVDSLKIDRSFITEIATSPGALTLVQTIVSLAHNMQLTVVAEGIETEAQLHLLRAIACDKAQGYLFSEALNAQDLEPWLASNQTATVWGRRSAC